MDHRGSMWPNYSCPGAHELEQSTWPLAGELSERVNYMVKPGQALPYEGMHG